MLPFHPRDGMTKISTNSRWIIPWKIKPLSLLLRMQSNDFPFLHYHSNQFIQIHWLEFIVGFCNRSAWPFFVLASTTTKTCVAIIQIDVKFVAVDHRIRQGLCRGACSVLNETAFSRVESSFVQDHAGLLPTTVESRAKELICPLSEPR